jgi:hypothetical protein
MKRTRMLRRAPTRRKPRKASERERIYGPKGRVEFVQSLPCIVCQSFPSDNMHIKGDGVSRKAGYQWIVPCCRTHHEDAHRIGIKTFARAFDIDLELAAIATQQQWLAYQARNPEHISSIVKRVVEDIT